jgi:hypothetical protein
MRRYVRVRRACEWVSANGSGEDGASSSVRMRWGARRPPPAGLAGASRSATPRVARGGQDAAGAENLVQPGQGRLGHEGSKAGEASNPPGRARRWSPREHCARMTGCAARTGLPRWDQRPGPGATDQRPGQGHRDPRFPAPDRDPPPGRCRPGPARTAASPTSDPDLRCPASPRAHKTDTPAHPVIRPAQPTPVRMRKLSPERHGQGFRHPWRRLEPSPVRNTRRPGASHPAGVGPTWPTTTGSAGNDPASRSRRPPPPGLTLDRFDGRGAGLLAEGGLRRATPSTRARSRCSGRRSGVLPGRVACGARVPRSMWWVQGAGAVPGR